MTRIEEENLEKLAIKGKRIIEENKEIIKKLRNDKDKLTKRKENKSMKDINIDKMVQIPSSMKKNEKGKQLKKKRFNHEKEEEEKKKALFEKELEAMARIEEEFASTFNITFGKDQENK